MGKLFNLILYHLQFKIRSLHKNIEIQYNLTRYETKGIRHRAN